MFDRATDPDQMKADAEKAFHGSIGAASPLWWAFAAAATTGAAYWLMTRWAKPVNLEAMAGAPKAPADPELVEAAATYELQPEAIEEVIEGAPEPAAVEAAPEPEPETEPAPKAEAAPASEPEPAAGPAPADDLTRIVGIGPKLAQSLAERGVTRFSQIAEWTEDDIARFNKDLNLMGKAARLEWVKQARTFQGA